MGGGEITLWHLEGKVLLFMAKAGTEPAPEPPRLQRPENKIKPGKEGRFGGKG